MRFAVKFLGCKVSHADAMLARQALLRAGHVEAPEEEAELHVINTCCITGEAEAKSRQSVRRSLKSGAREVYVGGCAANLRAAQFAEIDAAVRPFTGTAEDVAQAMAAAQGGCVDLEHEPMVGRAREQDLETRSASARTGTVAEGLGDRVPPQEKKRRSQALRGLSEVRSRHRRVAKLGGRERVLVDKVALTQCSGYTADYTRCYLPAGAAYAGELVEVSVRELQADGLRVTPV